jgi:hypothetical protein
MHQFLMNQMNVNFGGGFTLAIDDDIDDATIVAGNGAATKATANAFTVVDCAGEAETVPMAINDMSGSTFINGPGQIGTIVGYYIDSGNVYHGYQQVGGGTCTPIDFAGAAATYATGINNAGTVVGYWQDSNGHYNGFYQLAGSKPKLLDYNGATGTPLYSINDANQAVGSAYFVSSNTYQDFMEYYPNLTTPYNLTTGADAGSEFAINGDAALAGGDSTYFEENLVPPSWTGTPTFFPPNPNYTLYVYGLDNDNDLVGIYSPTTGTTCTFGCGFVLPAGSANPAIVDFQGSMLTWAYGINDFGQVVGIY